MRTTELTAVRGFNERGGNELCERLGAHAYRLGNECTCHGGILFNRYVVWIRAFERQKFRGGKTGAIILQTVHFAWKKRMP